MKDLGIVAGVIALSLLLLAGGVFGLDDRSIMVPSPSSAAEGFLRSLATHRYDPAVGYLDKELEERTKPEDLRELWEPIASRSGRIINVTGEWEQIRGDGATAGVWVESAEAGPFTVTLPLRRRSGVWKIAGLDGLATAAGDLDDRSRER